MEHNLDQGAVDRELTAVNLPLLGTYLASTASTNTDLRALAAGGAVHGAFLVTDVQTAGRGRLGRSWESPPGANLAMSILVRAALPPARLPLVCLLAAVVVAEAAGPTCRIKWPNDVLNAAGQKVAGILAEVEGDALVVGIGVNVRAAPPIPAAGVLDTPRARAPLAVAIVRGLLDGIPALHRDPHVMLGRWRALSDTLGRRVRIGEIEGIAVDVDAMGALLVVTDSGPKRVFAGDVEMISA